MIKTLFTTLLLIPSLTFAAAKQVGLDTKNSSVKWTGSKAFATGSHTGTIAVSGGHLMMDGDKITGGELAIDMTTIQNTDLTDAKMQTKLVGHLNSADFFDTANFKDAKFVVTKATAAKNGEYTLDGNMTIRGTTNPQTVKATVKKDGKTWMASGKMQIDRTKYNVKYSSQTAFPDLMKTGKDKIINDQFDIEFSVKTM